MIKHSEYIPTESDYLHIKSLAIKNLLECPTIDNESVAKAWVLATLEYLTGLGYNLGK